MFAFLLSGCVVLASIGCLLTGASVPAQSEGSYGKTELVGLMVGAICAVVLAMCFAFAAGIIYAGERI